MNSYKYTINKSSVKDIETHLNECSDLFSPSLDTYVNIHDYSNKIRQSAVTFEAWDNDKLIGLVACYFNDPVNLEGYITNVSVLKEYQGMKIAATLLDSTIGYGQDKMFKKISLEVEEENSNAIELYKKKGFYLSGKKGSKYTMTRRLNEHDNIMVSICCVTYNHKDYISQAIDSFLMQETNFPVEILIHDDASTDGTAEIVREYEIKYPDIIKPVYQKENQYSKREKISATYQWPRAKGKYIAMCEGDDYWTDPLKLQKQVDLLESNTSYAGIGTNVEFIGLLNGIFSQKESCELCISDFIERRPFHTATFLFRRELINNIKLPDCLSGDRALFLYISSKGLVYYLNECTAVYRKNMGGVSKKVTYEMMEKDLSILDWLDENKVEYPKKDVHAYILKTLIFHSNKISFRQFRKTYVKILKINGFSIKDALSLSKNYLGKIIKNG